MPKKQSTPPPQSTAPSLKVLAETKTEGVNKATSFRVDPKLITLEKGFNLRTEGEELDAHIERLYLAMRAGAFIPPIDVSVKNGKIIARDGHCRARAALRLRKEIPDYTLECRQLRGNDSDAILHMLGTGSGQKPLTPLEQGIGYLRLIKMGFTPVQIAEKLGVSRVTIDNGITLAEAPVEVQNMIKAGEVSSTTARDAVKKGNEGIEALKSAVASSKKNPEGAKKKVTAKNLRGTAGGKGKEKEPEPDKQLTLVAAGKVREGDAVYFVNPNEISITVNKKHAEEVAKFLRVYDKGSESSQHVASAIETALL